MELDKFIFFGLMVLLELLFKKLIFEILLIWVLVKLIFGKVFFIGILIVIVWGWVIILNFSCCFVLWILRWVVGKLVKK